VIEVVQRQLYPNDVREAMAGGPAELTALSRGDTHVLSTGTLLLIDSFIDQTSTAIRLKPVFASEDEELWSGDLVKACVLIEIRRDVLVIPAPAIQRGGRTEFLTEPDSVVEAALEVGPTTAEHIIVTSRLSQGRAHRGQRPVPAPAGSACDGE
jgi:multidrug efflux system membrane fusion protein